MSTDTKTLIDLETRFWDAMVRNDADAAVDLLCEPALMVSSHGAMKFDHAGYRRMADQASMVITSFEMNDIQVLFPNDSTAVLTYRVKQGIAAKGKQQSSIQEMNDTSTWVKSGERWKCAMHTETATAPHDVKQKAA